MSRSSTTVLIIVLQLLLVLRTSCTKYQLRRPSVVVHRSLRRPFQDIFLKALDRVTKPEDDEEDDVAEEVTTSAPTTLAPPQSSSLPVSSTPTTTAPQPPPPSSIPTTEPGPITVVVPPVSDTPSSVPSDAASSDTPSDIVSDAPTATVSDNISTESNVPSTIPSHLASTVPSHIPSISLSDVPSTTPSDLPSTAPSMIPSDSPSISPTTVPTKIPTMIPSDSPSTVPSHVPNTMPSSAPSDAPSILPSDVPSTMPSSVPSDVPSTLPSSVPSSVPSTTLSEVTSTIPSNVASSVPTGVPTVSPIPASVFNEEEIELFEETCTQFLVDYLPLVQPNTYSDLACNVVNQTLSVRRRRQLLEDDSAAVVPFKINGVEMLVAVTGNAPGETNFAQIVSKTFDTFGTELHDSLSKTSDVFSKGEDEVVTPVAPEGEATTVTNSSKNGPPFDWIVLGSAVAGGVVLALIVSLLLVKNKYRRQNETTTVSPVAVLSDVKSKSFSVSSERESSFREFSLIKLVSIEASRSLAKNDEEDDCMVLPPTPLGVESVPNSLITSQEEIKSELSPSSYLGDFACCHNALNHLDTFDGPSSIIHQNPDSSLVQDDHDGQSTFMTGISTAMMTNETATRMDHLSSSQSDSSDLEGLRLVVSNTNTFSHVESKVEPEQQSQQQQPVERFQAQPQERRGFFSFRRRTIPVATNAGESMDVEENCCATDSWTVRANSILTPRKANTTNAGNNSMKGQSGSF